jgi:hypothetical protein
LASELFFCPLKYFFPIELLKKNGKSLRSCYLFSHTYTYMIHDVGALSLDYHV